MNKAAGPDNMPGYILKSFADQCADVLLSSMYPKSLFCLVLMITALRTHLHPD